MNRLTILFLLLIFPLFTLNCNAEKSAEEEIEQLLHDFLYGASVNDAEMHDRFWADDLIYTSSSGQRYGKETIMRGMEDAEMTESPELIYTAEDIRINLYGDVAVLAFRLVGTSPDQTLNFLNSGTLVMRNGEWKVVNWQATRMAE